MISQKVLEIEIWKWIVSHFLKIKIQIIGIIFKLYSNYYEHIDV